MTVYTQRDRSPHPIAPVGRPKGVPGGATLPSTKRETTSKAWAPMH